MYKRQQRQPHFSSAEFEFELTALTAGIMKMLRITGTRWRKLRITGRKPLQGETEGSGERVQSPWSHAARPQPEEVERADSLDDHAKEGPADQHNENTTKEERSALWREAAGG